MRLVKKVVFWLHLSAGLLAGLVVLVLAVTGVIMSFERQILEANTGVTVKQGPVTVGPEAILGAHAESTPAASGVTFNSDPGKPAVVQFGRGKSSFVDPYTGESLGEGNVKLKKFFSWVLTLHRWLAQEGEAREVGKNITGVGNLVFLFLVVSGLWLWFPKRWTRNGLKAITTLQFRLKGRARDWNWHNVFGFWACVPLFFIVVTGAIMSYGWAGNLIYLMVGETPPPPRGQGGGGPPGGGDGPAQGGEGRGPRAEGGMREGGERRAEGQTAEGGERRGRRSEGGMREGGERGAEGQTVEGGERRGRRAEGGMREGGERGAEGQPAEGGERRGPRAEGGMAREGGQRPGGRGGEEHSHGQDEPASLTGLDVALAVVKKDHPDWETIQVSVPKGPTAQFAVSMSHRGRPDLRRQVTVDLKTAAITKSEGMESQSTGRKIRTFVRWVHTGEALGWFGQALMGLAALSAIILIWTGFALSWRRFFKRRKKTAVTAPAAVKEAA